MSTYKASFYNFLQRMLEKVEQMAKQPDQQEQEEQKEIQVPGLISSP